MQQQFTSPVGSYYRLFYAFLFLGMLPVSMLYAQTSSLKLEASVAGVSCSGWNDGLVDLYATGGDGNYTYYFNEAPSERTIADLIAGYYYFWVTDGTGSKAEIIIHVPEPPPLQVEAYVQPPLCHGNDGQISLYLSGGTAPYFFEWWKGNGVYAGNTQDLYGVSEGIYSVRVIDYNGCSVELTLDVYTPLKFFINTTEASTGNNGTITVTPVDASRGYTYVWTDDPAITTRDRTNLAPGHYTVKIFDVAANCEETITISVGGIACTTPRLSATLSHALCGAAGAVDLAVSGGEAPYTYAWSTGEETEDIRDLPAGTYGVTVTTAGGCTATATFVIEESEAPLITSNTVTPVSCLEKGSIEVAVTGGLAPYSLKVFGGYTGLDVEVAGTKIENLEKDCYTVQVLDAAGCSSAEQSICVSNLVYPVGLSAAKTDVSCNGEADGTIDLSVSSAGAPFTYSWSHGPATEDLEDLAPGTYEVTVTTADGCTGNLSVTITEPAAFAVELFATPASCKGEADGAVIPTLEGGKAPYTYSWTKEGDAAFHSSAENPASLMVGSYLLTVTDAAGCEASASVVVGEPEEISLSTHISAPSCAANTDGSIDVSVTGGTAPYVYSWASGQETEDLDAVGEGTYTLTVKDANGCQVEASYTLSAEDSSAPVARAQRVVIYLDKEGKAVLSPAQVDAGSTDNCQLASLSLDRTTFTCADAGLEVEVQLTALDAANNSSMAVATVQVLDTISPLVTASDLSLELGTDESITISVEDLKVSTSDACGVARVELSRFVFDNSAVGENEVVVAAFDAQGNVGYDTVVVRVAQPTGFFDKGQVSSVKVYPLPFKEELNFEIELSSYRGIEIELTDVLGHSVYRTSLSDSNGQKIQTSIPTAHWRPGVYFYRISQNRKYIATGKLLLLK